MELLYSAKDLILKGQYRGYTFIITTNSKYPTAYIKIEKNSIFYLTDYSEIDLPVHGRLTYGGSLRCDIEADNYYLGWDYAHFLTENDYVEGVINPGTHKWTTDEIIEHDIIPAIDWLIEQEGN